MRIAAVIDGRVYACIEDGYPTTGFVIGNQAVMVIDAQPEIARAQRVIAAIATITPLPIARLVFTGPEVERVGGAGAYRAYSTIASQGTFALLPAGVSHDRAARPNAIFEGKLTVDLGDYPVTAMQAEYGCQTGNSLVLVAGEGVVFAGGILDLRDPQRPRSAWSPALEQIRLLAPRALVSGWGDPCIGAAAVAAALAKMDCV